MAKANLTPQMSSFEVFMTFVENKDDAEKVNVDKVFSTECFDLWLKSRAKEPKQPTESFRRALTSHVRGTDQRKPFPPHVEQALLSKLRQKKSWECFKNLGRYGFRGHGFHESAKNPGMKQKKRKNPGGTFSNTEIYPCVDDIANIKHPNPYYYPAYPMPMKRARYPPFEPYDAARYPHMPYPQYVKYPDMYRDDRYGYYGIDYQTYYSKQFQDLPPYRV